MDDQDMEEGDYVDSRDEVEEGEHKNGGDSDWEDVESEFEDEPEGDGGEDSDKEGDLTDNALGPDDGEVDEDDIAVLVLRCFSFQGCVIHPFQIHIPFWVLIYFSVLVISFCVFSVQMLGYSVSILVSRPHL